MNFLELQEIKKSLLIIREVLRALDSDYKNQFLRVTFSDGLSFSLQKVRIVSLGIPIVMNEIFRPLNIRLLWLLFFLIEDDTLKFLLGFILSNFS